MHIYFLVTNKYFLDHLSEYNAETNASSSKWVKPSCRTGASLFKKLCFGNFFNKNYCELCTKKFAKILPAAMIKTILAALLISSVSAANASSFQGQVWQSIATSKCWGTTPEFTFIDPDQCNPACDDAAFPKFCSITYGAGKPDCTKSLPMTCRSLTPKPTVEATAAGTETAGAWSLRSKGDKWSDVGGKILFSKWNLQNGGNSNFLLFMLLYSVEGFLP